MPHFLFRLGRYGLFALGLIIFSVLLGSLGTAAAITFYKTAKMAATQNVPDAYAIIDDLQPMLPGIKASSKTKSEQAEQGEE